MSSIKVYEVGDRIPSGRTMMGTVLKVEILNPQDRDRDIITIEWDDSEITEEFAKGLPWRMVPGRFDK